MKKEVKIVRMTNAVVNAIYAGENPYSAHGVAIFKDHCEEIGASYYAEPNESFYINGAIRLAKSENNSTVHVENLS